MPTPSETQPSWIRRAVHAAGLILGPWPIRPLVFAVFVFGVVSFQQTSANLDDAVLGDPRFLWFEQAPRTILFTLVVIVPVWLAGQFRSRILRSSSRASYLLSVAAASLVAAIGALVVLTEPTWSLASAWTAITMAGRLLLMQLIIFTVFGFSQQRLSDEVDRANAAATELADQKEVMARTEEQSRRAVADFLHDRVQSMLVTSTMQLRSIAERTDAQSASELRSVAEYLDDLRAVDVREANTRLSPNIAVVGLGGCIEQLVTSLNPAVEHSVHIDSALREWAAREPDIDISTLGVFRIVEQSAANSVVHGHAQRIEVTITADQGWATVSVIDDGRGLPADESTGTGSAVIESWSQILRGRWHRVSRPQGGVEVTLTFPLSTTQA